MTRMKELHDERVAAAISRASSRYFDALDFVAADSGDRIPLHAVRRVVDAQDYSVAGNPTLLRRVELIVSRAEFKAIADGGLKERLARLRGATIEGKSGGASVVYRFDHARPYEENSPDGSSWRLFVYEAKDGAN